MVLNVCKATTDRYRLVLSVSLLREYCRRGESFFQCGIHVDLCKVMNFHLTSLLKDLRQISWQLLVDVLDIPQKLLNLPVKQARLGVTKPQTQK